MGFRIKHLTNQEKFVMEHWPARTYKAIALDLGVSPERVRQIHNKAERKLRALEQEKQQSNSK